ncbi:hypothetical protein DPEC_G00295880 [Dallia pectoralis]|uniref:Uncharacterized protein n=1 Tax=Dallia pectoralis TaxID=75939 RepID=A0ACC2FIL5_DALPE|nr:hypothetical protein DPEC_G00295880 [Dallia pectoralis]
MAASLDIIISAECRCADLAAHADPHDRCVACLGPDHAREGLLDLPECPSCALLTMPRRRERRGFFDEVVPLQAVLSSDSEAHGPSPAPACCLLCPTGPEKHGGGGYGHVVYRHPPTITPVRVCRTH